MSQKDANVPANSNDGLDVFGVGSVAKYLAGPIIHGVGLLLKPIAQRLDNSAQIANWNSWTDALEMKGYTASSVELNLGERAEVRMIAEAMDKQANREAVASEAIIYAQATADDPNVDHFPAPDYDWVDRFWSLAENVSRPDMQKLWGAVLARRATGTAEFSPRSLVFLSTLSRDEAQKLERIASYVVTYDMPNGQRGAAIMDQITDHTDGLDQEEKARLYELNRRLSDHVGDVDASLFGSLGIYLEGGWAYPIVQKPSSGMVSFTNAGLRYSGALSGKCRLRNGLYHIGGTTGISALGSEVFAMINPVLDAAYIGMLKEGLSIKGIDLKLRSGCE